MSTDDPAWTSDLAPAARKRSARVSSDPAPPPPTAAPPVPASPGSIDELATRLASIEQLVRAMDRRLVDGFEESASRAVVFAEATDDLIRDQGLEELRTQLAELSDRVDLLTRRLATLLGGPTLTELLDRCDEIDRHVGELADDLRAGRRPKLRADRE